MMERLHDILVESTLRFSHGYAIAHTKREQGSTDAEANEFLNGIPKEHREAYKTLYELTKHDRLAWNAYLEIRKGYKK